MALRALTAAALVAASGVQASALWDFVNAVSSRRLAPCGGLVAVFAGRQWCVTCAPCPPPARLRQPSRRLRNVHQTPRRGLHASPRPPLPAVVLPRPAVT